VRKEKNDGKSFKGGTVVNVLGRIRTKVEARFPLNGLWVDYSKKWFSTITANITKLNNRECNLTGETIEDKAPEIRRFLMKRIMKTYLSQMIGTSAAKRQIFAYRRVVLLMQYLAIGRVGEASLSSWNRAKWYNDTELLWMNWNERKTGIAFAPKVSSFWNKNTRNPGLALALKAELFHFPTESFNSGDLREFGWTLLASQLMYFATIVDTYGTSHPVPCRILQAGERVGLNYSTLREWDRNVRQLWTSQNFPTTSSATLNYAKNSEAINDKLAQLHDVQGELKEQGRQLQDIMTFMQRQADIRTEKELGGKGEEASTTDSRQAQVTPQAVVLKSVPAHHTGPKASKMEMTHILDVMYKDGFNPKDYFTGRDESRIVKAQKDFFDNYG
jgi:hypothetical protein